MINEKIQTSVEIAKSQLFSGVVIGLWVFFVLVFLIFGLIYKSKNSKWGSFWSAWGLSSILSGIVVAFVSSAPEQFLKFILSIKGGLGL